MPKHPKMTDEQNEAVDRFTDDLAALCRKHNWKGAILVALNRKMMPLMIGTCDSGSPFEEDQFKKLAGKVGKTLTGSGEVFFLGNYGAPDEGLN